MKIKLLPLFMVCILVLTACGGNSQPADTGTETGASPAESSTATTGIQNVDAVDGISDDATLNVALTSEPSALYPQYTENSTDSGVQIALYDTLVKYDDATGEVTPHLATSWEWVDATHIRFTLRDDVKFVNGETLSASDVLYTFQLGTRHNNKSAYTRIFDVDNFEVEDDRNIVFALNMSYPTLFTRIGLNFYGIVNEKAVEEVGGEEAAVRNPLIGTGKYKFAEWADGQYILLERNEDYWDQDNLPYYKYIKYTFISDAASRAMSIESGDVDAAEINVSQIAGLEGNDVVSTAVLDAPAMNTFYMNLSLDNEFQDVRVREAIYLLIDPEAVKHTGQAGFGTIGETQFSPTSYLHSPSGEARVVDVERAKELLAEAGYPDGFSFHCITGTSGRSLCEVIQSYLLEGGIQMEIETLETGAFISTLFSGDYTAMVRSMETYDPVISLNGVDGRVETTTAMGGAQYYGDDALEALIDAALYATEEDELIAAYAAVQQYVRDNRLTVGMVSHIRCIGYRSNLTNASVDNRGWIDYTTLRPAA